MDREDLGDLAIFLAVVEERSFTRAAARIGRSQSALSQTIRRLEGRLGVRLLARTTRSLAPTAEGERLLQSLRPALAGIDAGLSELRAMREQPSGTVRITAGRHAVDTVLWPAIVEMARLYPDVTLELSVDQALTDIVGERFDAGVRLGEQVQKDMIALRIGPDVRMIVVGAPSYLAAHGVPGNPHDLTRHRCINMRLPTAGTNYAWEFERDGRALNVRVDGPLVLNDIALCQRAAEQGLGLAILMEDMAQHAIAEGRLVPVLGEWSPPFPGYHLYYPDRRHPTPAFAALLAILRAQRPAMGN